MPDNVVEYRTQVRKQTLVARLGGKIGDPAVIVKRTYTVPVRLAQTVNINVVLTAARIVVRRIFFVFGFAAVLKEEARHVKIFAFSGMAVELYKGKLYFLVPRSREGGGLFGNECAFYAVAVTLHYAQKTRPARGFMICYRRFNEVSGAIKLMLAAVHEDALRSQLLVR